MDLFLFDYKITDLHEHRKFTGVSNRLILDNLEFLSEQGAHKYEEIGWKKPDLDMETVDRDMAQNCLEKLKAYGTKNVVSN